MKALYDTFLKRIRGDFFVLAYLIAAGYGFFVTSAAEMQGSNIVDDPDQDGLTTAEEHLYATNPSNRDSDGDGYSDGVEIRGGYDPLRKAPGDRIIPEPEAQEKSVAGQGGDNLTDALSEKIAALVQQSETGAEDDGISEVSVADLNSIADQIADAGTDAVTLPEVDVATIKIKEQSYSGLSKEKRKERIKEDISEYLTTISYIFASNSPKDVESQDDLVEASDAFANEAISAVSAGNLSALDSYVESGDRMLSQIGDIEVPERMLDTHVKALKLAMYMSQLKTEMAASASDDPVAMIKQLSKLQGVLNVVGAFGLEVESKLAEYDVSSISLDL